MWLERNVENMDYIALLGASLLFALQFLFNQRYEKRTGSGLAHAFRFSLWTSVVGAAAMLLMQGFALNVSWFSLLMAAVLSTVSILYTVCSMKAFATANLSVYSTFAMLGGMLIPFVGGLLIPSRNEELTWTKALCCVLLIVGLCFNVRREPKADGDKKKGLPPLFYYFAVFVLNGLSGLVSTLHQSFPDWAVDATSFSMLNRALTAVFALVMLLLSRQTPLPRLNAPKGKADVWMSMAAFGLICTFANWIVLLTLKNVDASLSYTLTTGAVMVFSTVIALIQREKVTLKQWLSVAFSMAGLLTLVIPT